MTSISVHKTLLLLAVCGSALGALGCESDRGMSCGTSQLDDPTATALNTHQFYYYPSTRVYRACEIACWYWPQGQAWERGANLPDSVDLGDEIPFVVELACTDPTLQHDAIEARYPMPTLSSGEQAAPFAPNY